MRTYEAMCVFRPEEDEFTRGKDAVRDQLKQLQANILKEEDMGRRTLAYPIKNMNQAHYYYYVVEMDPAAAHKTENAMKLKEELLRFLMVRREES